MILAIVIGLALAQTVQASEEGRRVAPLGNPADWIKDDDYPPAALRANETGVVSFELKVSSTGGVAGCRVTGPASPALDEATCTLLLARARFSPALDKTGRPIEAVFNSRVTWKMPEQQAVPLGNWHSIALVGYDAKGTATSCVPEKFGVARDRPGSQCGAFRLGAVDPFLPKMARMLGKPFTLVAENAIVFEDEPGIKPDFRYTKPGHRVIGVIRTRFEVSEAGIVQNCSEIPTGKESWLAQLPDICQDPGGKFVPVRGPDGAPRLMVGEILFAISVLEQ